MLFPHKSHRCEIFVRGQQFHISVIVQSVMVSFIERLNLLCKEKGISISKMIKDLGMANGNVTRWNKGSVPTGDNLTKIADYFNVSTDYLLGKTEKRKAPEGLTAKDLETLARIKYLQEHSPEDYALIKNLIETLANKQ